MTKPADTVNLQEHLRCNRKVRRAIETIRARYRLTFRADAIRLAVIVVAAAPVSSVSASRSRLPGAKSNLELQEHFLSDQAVRKAIKTIHARHGLAHRTDAIRLAVLVVAAAPVLSVLAPA